MLPYFIAVHAGAGYHGPTKEEAYTAAMRRALRAAAAALDQGCSSMDAVKTAICALEDAPITNAGFGSNLNMQRCVECDAGIMSGDGTCGAVGAVPGVDNPIAAAHRLAQLSRQPLPCGLVRPTLLVGDAARCWAVSQGLPAAATPQEAEQRLVCPAAAAAWERHRNILAAAQANGIDGSAAPAAATNGNTAAAAAAAAAALPSPAAPQVQQQAPLGHEQENNNDNQEPAAKRPRAEPAAHGQPSSSQAQQQQQQQQQEQQQGPEPQQPGNAPGLIGDVADAVGCVVVDGAGRVAAGVSSGGLAMKLPGRVGEAAVLGAGCWAVDGCWQEGLQDGAAAAAAGAAADDQGGLVENEGWLLPGVAVSASGVGERLMAANLARVAGMQLQMTAHTQIEPLGNCYSAASSPSAAPGKLACWQ